MAEVEEPRAVKSYKVVRRRIDEASVDDSFYEFENEVKLLMNDGYTPIGGIVLYQPATYNDRWVFQTMAMQ